MKLKKKIATLSMLLMLQTFGVNAAEIDNEIAVFAAEQDRNNEQVEKFDPESVKVDKNKSKTKDEIKAEEKRLEKEREEARKKIKEERKKSREELKGKTPISKNPAPLTRTQKNNSDSIAKNSSQNEEAAVIATPSIVKNASSAEEDFGSEEYIENPLPEENDEDEENTEVNNDENDNSQTPLTVALPNPVLSYANFNEMVQAVQFTPLYIPKKSGYDINSMMTINNKIAEIRYRRKWEQNVALHVRTYRRAADEELKDISGVKGVKWRATVANGISIYIAKISENKHVAAWAVGNYTFSAYVENLSFAAFHSLVSDELVDLSQHYYLGY